MTISRAFDPPSPGALASDVARSVQSSIFQRLRPRYKDRAGDLAWLIVRLGQPEHREHEEAFDLMLARPLSDLTALLSVVRAPARAPRSAAAVALVAAIAEAIETAMASVAARQVAR